MYGPADKPISLFHSPGLKLNPVFQKLGRAGQGLGVAGVDGGDDVLDATVLLDDVGRHELAELRGVVTERGVVLHDEGRVAVLALRAVVVLVAGRAGVGERLELAGVRGPEQHGVVAVDGLAVGPHGPLGEGVLDRERVLRGDLVGAELLVGDDGAVPALEVPEAGQDLVQRDGVGRGVGLGGVRVVGEQLLLVAVGEGGAAARGGLAGLGLDGLRADRGAVVGVVSGRRARGEHESGAGEQSDVLRALPGVDHWGSSIRVRRCAAVAMAAVDRRNMPQTGHPSQEQRAVRYRDATVVRPRPLPPGSARSAPAGCHTLKRNSTTSPSTMT
ncbi:hypothetical protein [Jannaschia sp. R86511]|uniref:hypothetical protein n=1 Tax=Jannaschia sp. R86511 TaxID=3093853 RepID=UPI0036D2C7A7